MGQVLVTLELTNKNTVDITLPQCVDSESILQILDLNYQLGIYVDGEKRKELVCVSNNTIIEGKKTIKEKGILKGYYIKTIPISERNEYLSQEKSIYGESYPEFNRSTRIKTKLQEEIIDIKSPATLPNKNNTGLLMTLIPAIATLILVIVVRGYMGKGGNYIIFCVASMILGIIMSVAGYITKCRGYAKQLKERKENYRSYIEGKQKEIQEIQKREKEILHKLYYTAEKEYEMTKKFSPNLFERRIGDEDFLDVYLGDGKEKSKNKITCHAVDRIKKGDLLEEIPEKMSEAYQYLNNVPIVCNLSQCNALGIVGEYKNREMILRRMVVDLITRHYYKDVNLYILANKESESQVETYRFIPHLCEGYCMERAIASDKRSQEFMLDYLYKRFTAKELEKKSCPWDIVVIYDNTNVKEHPVSKFIDHASTVGACFVCMAETKKLLPQGCGKIIEMKAQNQGILIDTDNESLVRKFWNECIGSDVIEDMGRILAPVYVKEVNIDSVITKSITLFDMLHIKEISGFAVLEQWNTAKVYETMQVPLGVGSKGKKIVLDIHEKQHGPHGLVAGTTGSGKSELLQSYILSMALHYPPYEVGFVIIDFKGGGMANQFADLPHLVGAITNIDDSSMERSLKSIQAELRKRQEVFAQEGVNHIDDYMKLRENRGSGVVLPHLIIVVDEFAELKAQQPEFMKELISASRIGRSLGVHLILATQKPSGQVNEQIWSNSKFKLCLKVQSASDSKEVLKTPLAANITTPGRCYLQVGNNEIFELFQSAYSGGSIPAHSETGNISYTISEIGLAGDYHKIYEQGQNNDSKLTELTQLEATVAYLSEIVKMHNISCASPICLPELEKEIAFPDSKEKKRGLDLQVEVGVLDFPSLQIQKPFILSVANYNIAIIGAARTGKTNLLAAIIRSLVCNYTPQEVNFYIMDFNSTLLTNVEKLKHCGGVVRTGETEKLTNLFKLLNEQIDDRRRKMEKIGVGSFAAYREAGYKELPYLVLFIYNFSALREMLEGNDSVLTSLCREGNSVGISIIVANNSSLSYKYMSFFSKRIAFYCTEQTEYSAFFEMGKQSLPQIPGRCLVSQEKEVVQGQIFLAFSGEREIERVEKLKQFVEEMNQNTDGKARRIPVIPHVLDQGYMKEEGIKANCLYEVIIGMDYATVEPVRLRFDQMSMVTVASGTDNDQMQLLRCITEQFFEQRAQAKIHIAVVGDHLMQYQKLLEDGLIDEINSDGMSALSKVDAFCRLYEERRNLLTSDNNAMKDFSFELLIVTGEVLAQIQNQEELLERLVRILPSIYTYKMSVLWLGIENKTLGVTAKGIYKVMKEQGKFLVYEDADNIKIAELSLLAVKKHKNPRKKDEAFWCVKGNLSRIKMVCCESTER